MRPVCSGSVKYSKSLSYSMQSMLSVQNASLTLQTATASLLKVVYNVYFRHPGIPGKFWFTATDWTFWKHYQVGKPYEVIAELHRELGADPHVSASTYII